MVSSIITQALVAAFAYGIVLNAASASLYAFTKDHGWKSFRDGPRLVLILFLSASAVWSVIAFIGISTDGSAIMGCQIISHFAFAFDQIARVAFIQFLLWAIQNGSKATTQTFVLQGMVLIRLLAGGVVVGTQRAQVGTEICVATNILMPLSFVMLVVDFVVALFLLFKIFTQGSFKIEDQGNTAVGRRKALLLAIAGFVLWTSLSTPMIVGMESWTLLTRTFLPALGLAILVAIFCLSKDHLSCSTQRAALDDNGAMASHATNHTRQPGSQDSGYSSDQYAPPGRYDAVKTNNNIVSISAFAKEADAGARSRGLPQSRPGQLPPVSEERSSTQKRSRAVAPQKLRGKGGKISISAPVLQTNNDASGNPWGRIATTDLTTAAHNEQLRREMMYHQPLSSHLVATRPAPKRPVSPETMMRTGAYLKRKQLAPTTEQSLNSEPLLDPAIMVTTTSSQLSPGADEIRRRSPRTATNAQTSANTVASPPVSQHQPKRSQHALSMISINEQAKQRPTSTLALTPPPKSPVRALPPVSPYGRSSVYTTTMGAPPTATSMSVKVIIKDSPLNSTFMAAGPNVPQKDNAPTTPARPMAGLPRNPKMGGVKPVVKHTHMQRSETVMLVQDIEYKDPAVVQNILREAEAWLPAQAMSKTPLNHTGSIVHRPRPIPRQSEVDRQIWPAEESPSSHKHKRSLSGGSMISRKSILQSRPTSPTNLPPLPPVPQTAANPGRPQPNNTVSMTFDEKMHIFYASRASSTSRPSTASSESEKQMRRRSRSVPELPELPEIFRERQRSQSRDPLRDSTYQSSRSSIRTSLLNFPEVPTMKGQITKDIKRSSSPVLPSEVSLTTRSPSATSKFNDDETTIWGSIYSPVKGTKMQRANTVTVPPVPSIGECPAIEAKSNREEEKSQHDASTHDDHVMMTVVLDTQEETPVPSKEDEIERVMSKSLASFPTWHRRIGDELATFSGRPEHVARRNKPPPAALALRKPLDQRQRTNPAPPPPTSPLETPRKILETIQEQLRKFEDPDRTSTGSQQAQRMTLLQNLELEMGEYEGEWEKMQARLNTRDSYSTTAESRRDSLAVSVVEQANRDSVMSNAQIRGARPSVRLSENKRTASVASQRSTQSSENDDQWDQDLADAQAEYLKHRFQLVSSLSKRNTDKVLPEVPSEDSSSTFSVAGKPASLWQPKATSKAAEVVRSALWNAKNPSEMMSTRNHVPETRRCAPRVAVAPLEIETDQLWKKTVRRTSFAEPRGMWNDRQPKSIPDETLNKPQRPLTQRPARRSKRVTLLPDILENPEPMPNKRGTLALYQFPWGEKSDSAEVMMRPKAPMYMAMPGTMTSARSSMVNPGLHIPINPFEFDPENYGESYFDDDYDEDEGDRFPGFSSDEEEEDEDEREEDYCRGVEDVEADEESDDFDESTLWEIASLLKSNDVPSRDSLLPEEWEMVSGVAPPQEYKEELEADIADEVTYIVAPTEGLKLWAKEHHEEAQEQGLPAPDCQTWEGYLATTAGAARTPPRVEADLEEVESRELWAADVKPVVNSSSPLWSVPKSTEETAALWTAQAVMAEKGKGLASPNEQVWASYQLEEVVSRALSRPSEPSIIESVDLWRSSEASGVMVSQGGMWEKVSVTRSQSQSPLMWSPSTTVEVKSTGLAQPSQDIWASYQPEEVVSRASSRPSEPSTIDSVNLWKSPQASGVKESQTGMWEKVSAAQSSLMWSPRTAVEVSSAGLPQPSDYIWAAYQVNGIFARAANRHAEPAVIKSSSLWSAPACPVMQDKTGMWQKTVLVSAASTATMWSPPTKPKEFTAGLAQPDSTAWEKYTALPSPARVTRSGSATTATLSSNALWGTAAAQPQGDDWMTLSTTRARSPSNASTVSTASDAASVKTTATNATTATTATNVTKASSVGSFFGSFWKKSRSRGVSDASTTHSVKGSRELAFEDIPEVPIVPVDVTYRPASETKKVEVSKNVVPLRKVYRKTVAVNANWDLALKQALEASYPAKTKTLQRIPAATAQDWDAALQQALSLSFPSSTIPARTIAYSNPTIASTPLLTIESSNLWAPAALRSPHPPRPQLWSSRHSFKDHAAFPDAPVLPLQSRRTRAGSEASEGEKDGNEMLVVEGLTEQSLWRRSLVEREKGRECRTRDWLSRGEN